MLVDLLALLVLAASAFLGWRRSFAPHLPVALGVWLGLAAAGLLILPLGGAFRSLFGIGPLQAWLAVALSSLGLVLGGMGYLSWRAGHKRKTRILDRQIVDSKAGRVGGALIGLVAGAPLVVMLAWGAMFAPRLGPMAVEESRVAALGRDTLRQGLRPVFGLVLGDATLGAMAADGMADPLGALAAVRAVGQRPAASLLLQDPAFARAMIGGYGKAAAYHPLVHQILRDPEAMRIAESRGWVNKDFSIHDFREALAASFPDLAPRLRALRYDPEVVAALDDPMLAGLLAGNDIAGLVSHPRGALVIERVLGKVKDDGFGLDRPSLIPPPKVEAQAVPLSGTHEKYYRWEGKDGVEILSNSPPSLEPDAPEPEKPVDPASAPEPGGDDLDY